jgi:hypothetical protein
MEIREMASKNYRLRIYHDHLTEGAEAVLTSERRIVYCVSGNAVLSSRSRKAAITNDEGHFSDDEVTVRGEGEGARLWRWELVALDTPPGEIKQTGIKSINAGDYEIPLDTSIKRIMRLDRVSFPLGGEALTHIHAAPGVRCMLAGNLLLDSVGHRYRAWPGDSWVEHGPDHVYAKASENELSSFVRVMIVPEEYRGRSTITYVRADDQDKPKSQTYKRYLEEPITL